MKIPEIRISLLAASAMALALILVHHGTVVDAADGDNYKQLCLAQGNLERYQLESVAESASFFLDPAAIPSNFDGSNFTLTKCGYRTRDQAAVDFVPDTLNFDALLVAFPDGTSEFECTATYNGNNCTSCLACGQVTNETASLEFISLQFDCTNTAQDAPAATACQSTCDAAGAAGEQNFDQCFPVATDDASAGGTDAASSAEGRKSASLMVGTLQLFAAQVVAWSCM